MVELAAADGITQIVATPHCSDTYPYSLERNRTQLAALRTAAGARVTLVLGCDFHLSYENLQALLAEPHTYTINQGPYLLVELANYAIVPQLADILHQLRLKGLIPVVTHPERNPLLQRRSLKLLQQFVAMGCPVQVTAGSLQGHFGKDAQAAVERLLRHQLVHLVGSDAHNVTRRPPQLSTAYAVVEQNYGVRVAAALFRDNPSAVIRGASLPYLPEVTEPRPKRRFWSF